MVDSRVLIGIVTGEYARRADFYDYVNLLQKPANTFQLFSHDRSPAHGRNLIINAALENDCTHILFMDDDMVPKPDALLRLLAHDVDSISGLYLSRAYPHQPLIFDDLDEEGRAIFSYLEDDLTGLKPIAAAGLGFYLVKTDVLRAMPKPWFRLGELDSEQWCDDIGYFYRLRQLGVESYCDLDVQVGHIGTFVITPNIQEDNKWYSSYDTNGKGGVNTPQIALPDGYKFEK
jgi:hypothetical protein